MKIYAEVPHFRTRQMLQDGLVALWVVVWIRIGMWIDTLVNRLASPGRSIQGAGSRLSGNLETIGGDISGIPVVGSALQGPFEAAARAGDALSRAGGAADRSGAHPRGVARRGSRL